MLSGLKCMAQYLSYSVQFISVTQSCATLCDPIDCSTLGLPVHYQPLEFAQVHVHWIKDAIQPSHPLLPFFSYHRSFPASGSFPMYWHFPSGSQNIRASALSISPSNEYLRLISFRMDWFDLLAVQGTLKIVFSNTTVQKHQFFHAQPSLWSNSHTHSWLLEKP